MLPIKCLLGKYSTLYKIVISLNIWFKRHGLCKSMKKKKNMDTLRSKKKKIGTHEGPKVLKKRDEHMKAHKKKKIIK